MTTTEPTLHDLLARIAALEAERAGRLTRQSRRSRPARLRRLVAALFPALLVALVPLALLAANPFTDLNPGSVHNANIDAIYGAGITKGCVPNESYCPNDNVTREEMASFLARTAGLGGNPPVANALTAVNAPNAQPKYSRTVVVSPVGTAVQNGVALLAALEAITTASSTNPWLLKIEPGIYDLDKSSLAMKPYVDIEGSGEAVTTIQSLPISAGVYTIVGTNNAELRFLTVLHIAAPGDSANAIGDQGVSARYSHLTIRASGSSTSNEGIRTNSNSTSFIQDVTIYVVGPGGAVVSNNANPHIDSSRLIATNGGNSITAFSGGTVSVSSSLLSGVVNAYAGATARCAAAYKANFILTTPVCQ